MAQGGRQVMQAMSETYIGTQKVEWLNARVIGGRHA